MKYTILVFVMLFPTVSLSQSSYSFNNPSFSGMGWSSHVLTLEQMTQKNASDLKAAQEAAAKEALRQEENSNLNKFLRNFESRVYAEISRQLTDALFGENPSAAGSIVVGGSTIEYINDGSDVTLTITAENGDITVITVPIGTFGL